MDSLKFFAIGMIIMLSVSVSAEEANAFTLFGIDFGKIWGFFTGMFSSAEKDEGQDDKVTSGQGDDGTGGESTAGNQQKSSGSSSGKSSGGSKSSGSGKSSGSSSGSAPAPKPAPVVDPGTIIYLDGTKYTETGLKATFKSRSDIQGYVKGFNYECVYVSTDKGEEFTMFFDTSSGYLKSLEKGKDCDREIGLEESLIGDFSRDGFKVTKVKSYLERVDLPTTMYFKALKVFTVG